MRFIIIFLILSSIILYAQKTNVHGRLSNSIGESIPNACVNLSLLNNPDIENKVVKTNNDGGYEIATDRYGIYELIYAAPNYKSEKAIIINDKDQSITIDVKLGDYFYNNNFDSVKVVGEFNNYNFSTAKVLKKNKDGTYTFEMECPSPEFKYQLIGITPRRSINGTESDRYEYDNGGDFRSVIKTVNGKAKFAFDPNKLSIKKSKGSIDLIDSDNLLTMLNDYYPEYEKYVESEFWRSNADDKLTNEINNQIPIEKNDFYSKLKEELKTTSDPVRKKLASIFLLCAKRHKRSELDSVSIVKFYDSLNANSPYWSIGLALVDNARVFLPKDKYENLVNDFIKINKDDNFVSYVVSTELVNSIQSSNQDKAKQYYKILSENYSNTNFGAFALHTVSMRKELNVGDDIPDYNVPSLDNPKKFISKQGMLGKIYLIDFWGTWCGGCRAEMGNLHNVYEKYHNKGFVILSLAMDQNKNIVKEFRIKKWKMPWLHSFISNKSDDPFFKRFDVIGYPKPILVDKNGKIIAIENELRGDNLDKTLSKYFKN